jgi:uncharacterized protein involved in exopolysaccharide biosynthesis
MPRRQSSRRRLRHYLEAPLRRPRLLLAPALAVGLLAAALSLTLPAHYRSSALVAAQWADADDAMLRRPEVASRRSQQVRQRMTERALLEQVLRETQPYTKPGAAPPPLQEQVGRLLADLRVRPATPSTYVVEFVHRDPAKAALVPNRLVTTLAGEGSETGGAALAAVEGREPGVRFKLIGAAAIPPAPESPSPAVFGVVGAFLGLALGLVAALVAEHRDESVKGPEDLAAILDVPLLATLPEVRERDLRD